MTLFFWSVKDKTELLELAEIIMLAFELALEQGSSRRIEIISKYYIRISSYFIKYKVDPPKGWDAYLNCLEG